MNPLSSLAKSTECNADYNRLDSGNLKDKEGVGGRRKSSLSSGAGGETIAGSDRKSVRNITMKMRK